MEELGLGLSNPCPNFWRQRSVFVTGHTGFKGGWLALWLSQLGAKVYGYSLEPPTTPNYFKAINLQNFIESSTIADVRDLQKLISSMQEVGPTVVIHMAAQPFVRESYRDPVDTFSTNVMGTVNLLEAVRNTETVKAVVNVTTDKCYENQERSSGYNENDRLGGSDPYSSSKACSEFITEAYRKSFFKSTGIHVATARAGNVIGGGDWGKDRLIPDFFRAVNAGTGLRVRSPNAVRPWQHVLDPISGYLILAERLVNIGIDFADAWNFGPEEVDAKPVSWVVDRLCRSYPNVNWELDAVAQPKESVLLTLDNTKAKTRLQWRPKINLEKAIDNTIEWAAAWQRNEPMEVFSIQQIKVYESL